jgi:SAM-dependent methyltransferase
MGALTSPTHWDSRLRGARPRPPSLLNVAVADVVALLGRHVKAGDRVLEIGCAPGKFLLWCKMVAGADVSGVEYAPESFADTVRLFEQAGQAADLRHEDIFDTTFGAEFDVVYSFGLIEHFYGDQLERLVQKHVELLKPGGIAVISIPDYQRIYGAVLSRTNRANYDSHNIELMSLNALRAVAPPSVTTDVFRYGRFAPWYLSFGVPRNLAVRYLFYGLNVIGLLQPFKIDALCPTLVLTMKK